MASNLRGRLYAEYDGAGIAIAASYDFKGNLLRTTRQMLADYRAPVDWTAPTLREAEVFSSQTSYA
jgi:hypothetical protein